MTDRPSSPWTGRARAAAAAGLLVGALLVIVGWQGANSADSLSDSISWLNFGVLGAIVGSATVIFWLLAARRMVTLARNAVIVAYAGDFEPAELTIGPRLTERVTVAGSTWIHRPDCLLVLGKPLVDAGRAKGLAPCQVCGG